MNSRITPILIKYIILAATMILGFETASAIQASRRPIPVRQPDGTTIQILRRGDERRHAIYSPDGSLLRKDAHLGFVKSTAADIPSATPSTRGTAAAARNKRRTRGPGLFAEGFPSTGRQKGLVILVEFQDRKFNTATSSEYHDIETVEYFNGMLNTPGFSLFGATGSAADWFRCNSGGQLEPEFDLYGPVTLSQPVSYYGKNKWNGDDIRAHEMVTEACDILDSSIDFREYDRDNDGYVDNVYIFYAGYGEADSEFDDTVWPHNWEISAATGKAPPVFDGVKVDRYACSNETERASGRPVGIGTFVHEFSHVLGLPDLYCTDGYLLWQNMPFTPGEYSVMDYGPYNNDGRTPPNYSAYERYALGWLNPTKLDRVGEHSLEEISASNSAFLILTDREQEYFLLENRQNSGWDTYLPGHGMLVWHVDYDRDKFYDNNVNNDRDHQYVDLVEADGLQDYPKDANLSQDDTASGDPFPGIKGVTAFDATTDPALLCWSGESTGVAISDIRETDGVINFSAEVSAAGIDEIISSGEDIIEIFSLEGIRIYRGKAEGILNKGNLEGMPSLKKGIYIIKIGSRSFKALIS